MISFLVKHLRLVLLILFVAACFFIWDYVSELRSRFPNLDTKRSRIGIASWYSESDKRINERTASGEPFSEKAMTCASWDYPFGEKLLIINPLNGEWVVCRVNDRGPNRRLHRAIDLTKATFRKISSLKWGLIHVFIIPTAKRT
jgi:rare lipoprotein A